MEVIRPQPGPQEDFLSSPADIVIAGGAYFGGKTWGCLLDVLRDIRKPSFRAVFFRRIMPQIVASGGLWDDAQELYMKVGATCIANPHKITFPSGANVTFSHLQREDDRYDWDGAQIDVIYFDQLEQFTEKQFWHLALGRNRSRSGGDTRIRATCNPLPKMWLSELLQWWWDPETGYAIKERSGVIKFLLRVEDTIYWDDSVDELRQRLPDLPDDEFLPLSFTFIPSTLDDNPIGVARNPRYAAQLQSLPLVERERGRKGNWKIEDITGDGLIKLKWWVDKIITREVWGEMMKRREADKSCAAGWRFKRGWDFAGGTSLGADYTVGALVARAPDERRFIVDIARGKWSPHVRAQMMEAIITTDEKFEAISYGWKSRTPDMNKNVLAAVANRIWLITEKGSKLFRAQTLAQQIEAGNYYLVEGDWNMEFMMECARFTGEESTATLKDDQVDATVLADRMITQLG